MWSSGLKAHLVSGYLILKEHIFSLHPEDGGRYVPPDICTTPTNQTAVQCQNLEDHNMKTPT